MADASKSLIAGGQKPELNLEPFVGLYTLWFRHVTNHLQSLNFRHHGNLRSAQDRGRKHCDVMGYKFHFVQPLIVDIDLVEQYKLGHLEGPRQGLPSQGAESPETKQ